MTAQNLTPEIICERTGLFMRSFQWIMTNGFASEDAMERLAEAAGAKVGELLLPDFRNSRKRNRVYQRIRKNNSDIFTAQIYKPDKGTC